MKKFLSFLLTLIFTTGIMFAQSSGDKLYNQGLQLQKTMTIQAQNSAISKFNSAKKLYDSAAKKAQCDQAISVSRSIIANLKGGGGGGKNNRNGGNSAQTHIQEEVRVAPKLEVSNSQFDLDLIGKTLTVNVNTNQDNWSVSPILTSYGSSFISVNKTGDSAFDIIVPQNYSAQSREQKVMVTAGDITKYVTVTQTGRHVDIDANKKTLKFKEKGGDQKIDVSCNSDISYEDNYNENWYIESKPSWIIVTINEKREKGFFSKMLDKGEELIKGKKSDDATMVKSSITVTCAHLQPGTAEAFTGRKGEIVLRSGDTILTIYVSQLGKDSTVK